MPSSRKGKGLAGLPGGRFPKRVVLGLFFVSALTQAQARQKPAAKKAQERANELTLAGLQPGRATLNQAARLYRKFEIPAVAAENAKVMDQKRWEDPCRTQTLTVDLDAERRIRVIRVNLSSRMEVMCSKQSPSPWKTGRGLRVGDPQASVVQLYGQPDSRSPSTRDGQPLELLYYAFDWAGPDVPQVMEVLCTRQQDGQPGRVVEITLAAPSL